MVMFLLIADHSLREPIKLWAVVEFNTNNLAKVDFLKELKLDGVDFIHCVLRLIFVYKVLFIFGINMI